ncbi:Hypothetical predicted protein, partial [Marmota monax]
CNSLVLSTSPRAPHEPSSRSKASPGKAKPSAAANGSKTASHPWPLVLPPLQPTVALRIPRTPSHSMIQRLRPTTQVRSSSSEEGTSRETIPGSAVRSSTQSAESSSDAPSHAPREAPEQRKNPQRADDFGQAIASQELSLVPAWDSPLSRLGRSLCCPNPRSGGRPDQRLGEGRAAGQGGALGKSQEPADAGSAC